MRQHLAWPQFHLHAPDPRVVSKGVATQTTPQLPPTRSSEERVQVIKDKIAVAAVLILVLATLTVFVLYLVHQAPHFTTGQLTALATPAPGAQGTVASASSAESIAGTGLGRIPLILISTVVEMAIFVALGLYLRHDMKRKP